MKRGGGCLDDDQDPKGITSTTSTDFNRTSTGVEVFGNELKDSDLENNPINNNNYVCTGDHFNKSQVIQQPDDEGARASACDCDPGIVEVQKSNPAQSPAIGENCPQEAPLPLQQTASTAEVCGSVAKQSAGPPGPRSLINARDNTLLDIPEKTPCYVCGGTWSLYVEKLTEERRGIGNMIRFWTKKRGLCSSHAAMSIPARNRSLSPHTT